MKDKRKNHSVLFRGLVLTLAFALAVLCLPFNGIVALAQLAQYTDYSYMTIGQTNEEIASTVNKGSTYYIPKAFVGGNSNFVVGKMSQGAVLDGSEERGDLVTIKSSKITVSYSEVVLGGIENSTAMKKEDESAGIVSVTADADGNAKYYGSFVADKIGQYTITYSYDYVKGENTYTNSYEFKIDSQLTSASISFSSNQKEFLPSIYDLSQAKVGDSYKDLYIPTPEIVGEDGEDVDATIVTSEDEIGASGNYVYLSASCANATEAIEISKDSDGKFYVAGDVFKIIKNGNYVFTFAYYTDGQFVTSTTKTVQVKESYYKDYKLNLELASDWSDNGQTGVETKLPSAKGVTSKDSTPASETVDVYSTVTVYFKSTNSDKNYELLDATYYNSEAGEKIVNEDGTLVDSTKFKPLKDGWYTFVYTIYDAYYVEGNANAKDHMVSSTKGVYEYANITDESDPTPIVYDASVVGENKYEDASDKLASRSVPNSVVVYAIGIEDNVSKNGDADIELTRKIMTSDTVEKLAIKDYDNYNLIFNYRKTTNDAYLNLRTNNYLIERAIANDVASGELAEDIATEKDMLAWLAKNNYRIVVDNANYSHIYSIFKDENVFAEGIDSANKALDWFKTEEALNAGFAYIDVNETFGATTSDNGMGSGQYYIHYIAKDAAGNEKDVSKSMYIGSYVDDEIPEIKFATTLADSYLPTSKITFDAPTASDNYDTNMVVKTYYRYLNGNTVIDVNAKNDDGTISKISNENLNELWKTFTTKETKVNGTNLTETYKEYHKDSNDGYVDLTKKGATSYTIDLSADRKLNDNLKNATSLQIVAFAYDDQGNANIYAETINISNTIDQYAPKFEVLEEPFEGYTREYQQGAEIELPTLKVFDDAVPFMSYNVDVYYIANDGTKTKISTYDSKKDNPDLEANGTGRFFVYGGKFNAAFAGEYQASISATDSSNRTIVSFLNYKVSQRNIVQPPEISVSLESKTIQLDGDSNYNPEEGIVLPTPTVSYQIPDSVTYDRFVKDGKTTSNTYIIRGVNENGKAVSYSTTYGQGSFKPTKVGTYPIVYTVKLYVYNHNTFEYVEMSAANDYQGGYYTFKNNGKTINFNVNDKGELESTQIEEDKPLYVVKKNDNGQAVILEYVNDAGYSYVDKTDDLVIDDQSVFHDFGAEKLLADMTVYTRISDVYTISVKDSIGPKIAEEFYPTAIAKESIYANAAEGYKLKIYGISAEDKSGINMSKSKVVLSWKLANGTTGSHTWNSLVEDTEYEIKSNNGNILDGTYKVTYTVYDNNNNYTTKEYEIAVGDNLPPTLTFDDEFVNESYEIGSTLKIDPTKIQADDNGNDFAEGTKPVIKLVNSATGKEVSYDEIGGLYVFDEFEDVGTYTLTVEIEDAVGNKTTESFSIEVSAKKSNTETTYKVVGTILIVISVLVLAGVIIYFIVSKVKLDKELKK